MSEETRIQAEYTPFVRSLTKPGEAILSSLTARRAHLLHMAIGLSGEVLELIEASALRDSRVAREELGDMEFFLEGVRGAIGVSYRPSVIEQSGYHCSVASFQDLVPLVVAVGALADRIKKYVIYENQLAVEALPELLDAAQLELAKVEACMCLTRDVVLEGNMAKLRKRYPDKAYTDKAAEVRSDKAGESA